MAFMVPIMKNNYDIYKGHDNALVLSTTSTRLPRSGGGQQKQQKVYRFMISGGKVVAAKPIVNANAQTPSGRPRSATTQSAKGYYRTPSASISLPVKGSKPSGKADAVVKAPDSPTKSIMSNGSTGSPPANLRPMPHAKRTVRNPVTNRVYSYSVSIPDYVAEEDEEEFHDAQDDDDFDDDDEKESQTSEEDPIVLFATSAPGGTGSIIDMASPKNRCKTAKASFDDHFTSHQRPHRTMTQTSQSSDASSRSSNTREYMELVRKFVLHLKMVKIFHGHKQNSGKASNSNSSSNGNSASQRRKRKDTMEDTNNL